MRLLKAVGLIVLAFTLVAVVHVLMGTMAAVIVAIPIGYVGGTLVGDIIHG